MVEVLDKKSYTLFLNSADKISGTNNNAVFQVNWDDFLPRNYSNYKSIFTFQTTGGYYIDYVGSVATSFTATVATSGVMTVTAPPTGITFSAGMLISGGNIPAGIYIQSLSSQTSLTLNYFPSAAIASSQFIVYSPVATPITYNSAKVVVNTLGRSYSFDSNTKSPSTTMGIIQRDIQVSGSSTSSSNTLSCFYLQNPPRSMSRPNQNMINVQIYNTSNNALLTTTDSFGNTSTYAGNSNIPSKSAINSAITDMTPWQMAIDFIPIADSLIPNIKSQET